MKRFSLVAVLLTLVLLTACAGPQVKLFPATKAPLKEVTIEGSGEDKVLLVAGLSRDLVQRGLSAGNWVRDVAPVVGGGGGWFFASSGRNASGSR